MKTKKTMASWLFICLALLGAMVLTTGSANAQVVIGSWQDNDGDGWIDWGNGFSITDSENVGKYSFVSGAVTGYPQSLQIGQSGYQQNLAIKLQDLPGGKAAFLANHLLSFTFSVPPAASSGSTAGYSQLWEVAINASGYGFHAHDTNQFTATGFTNNNQGWQPNFNFYSGAPARSQVVTLNYSNILSAITATPSDGYVELIFSFNTGGGAPTNFFINNMVLSGGPPNPPAATVIGSWQGAGSSLSTSLDEGWIDWGNQFSITNPANAGKYAFVNAAVSSYARSLQISQAGYNQNLAIQLEYLPGGVAAFLTNHLLSFTFSVPPATNSGSSSGYSQLWEVAINATGYGFQAQQSSQFSSTGFTNDNQGWRPHFDFYFEAPARSQVVTLNYSNILSAITATPSDGYVELIFAFNNGDGAPTNYFINNVVLWGGSGAVGPNPPPAFTGVSRLPGGAVSLTATGAVNTPYRLWASTNVALSPVTNTWTLLTNSTVTASPFTNTDSAAPNFSRRFYRFSSP